MLPGPGFLVVVVPFPEIRRLTNYTLITSNRGTVVKTSSLETQGLTFGLRKMIDTKTGSFPILR